MTINGFLVINKQAGMTSHSVVSRVRRITGEKKAGHTGTLDPFATGVLPVAIGEATKSIQFLDESEKEYRAVMMLGRTTDTQDCTGTTVAENDWRHVTEKLLESSIYNFTGPQQQVPPMFSAVKMNGIPLYRLARKGGEVDREPRGIYIHDLVIESIKLPEVCFSVRCSRGTYVRTLANDIGESLGCGAHLTALCRTKSGPFAIADAVTLDELVSRLEQREVNDLLVMPEQVLSHMRVLHLDEHAARRVRCGSIPARNDVVSGNWPVTGERVRLTYAGEMLAVAEGIYRDNTETLRLVRVFG